MHQQICFVVGGLRWFFPVIKQIDQSINRSIKQINQSINRSIKQINQSIDQWVVVGINFNQSINQSIDEAQVVILFFSIGGQCTFRNPRYTEILCGRFSHFKMMNSAGRPRPSNSVSASEEIPIWDTSPPQNDFDSANTVIHDQSRRRLSDRLLMPPPIIAPEKSAPSKSPLSISPPSASTTTSKKKPSTLPIPFVSTSVQVLGRSEDTPRASTVKYNAGKYTYRYKAPNYVVTDVPDLWSNSKMEVVEETRGATLRRPAQNSAKNNDSVQLSDRLSRETERSESVQQNIAGITENSRVEIDKDDFFNVLPGMN